MREGRVEGAQTRNVVESSTDLSTMSGNFWVMFYILGVAQERAGFS